jgi:TRAF3-interacting protein 1
MDGAGEQQSAGIAVGLITEDDDTQDEEFDMAAEEAITGFSGISGWDKEQTEDVTVDEDGVHGKLVGDILAEKKKLQEETQQKPPEPAPEQHQGIVITKKRRSSVETNTRPAAAAPKPSKQSENDVAHLREEIQTLCQSTNPLGKCIEFIQEDLENMEKEYSMWKSDSQKYSMKLDAQADNTESSLVPLQQELADEVEKVANLTSQINRIKASIMHNDATIHNLLRGVVGTNPQ